MIHLSEKTTVCSASGLYTRTKFLLAPHCDAQNCLSAPALTGDFIDIATEHANTLSIISDAAGCSTIAYTIEPSTPLVVARQIYEPR